MLLGTLLTGEIAKSATVAYVHYLGIILCFGSLLFERLTLKVGLNRNETISMIIADVVYGLAGVAILVTGILRVKYFGCLLYTSPSPRDLSTSRMPSSA